MAANGCAAKSASVTGGGEAASMQRNGIRQLSQRNTAKSISVSWLASKRHHSESGESEMA
jgi:hypothetical protein